MSTHPNCPICGGGGTGSTHPCACAPDNASRERLHPTWPSPPDTGRTHYDGCWRERGHHNCAVVQVDTLAAQLAGVRAERDALESEIRSLLAWGHGHTGLYTDDGELSCGECLLDFRRDSLDVIRRRIREHKMAELAALATPARPTDTGRDG